KLGATNPLKDTDNNVEKDLNMEDIKQLSDDVIKQIKDFYFYYHLTEEQDSLLINKLIIDKELKNITKNMAYVMNANSLKIIVIGVEFVNFNETSKIGPAETMMSISSFKRCS